MNDRGAGSLLRTKVKLGADASIAAGPKGRSAAADTDAYMRAEILSYSRARGVFAGISLEGSTLRPDEDANRKLYGNSTSAAKIISDSDISAPSSPHDRGPAKVISTTQALAPFAGAGLGFCRQGRFVPKRAAVAAFGRTYLDLRAPNQRQKGGHHAYRSFDLFVVGPSWINGDPGSIPSTSRCGHLHSGWYSVAACVCATHLPLTRLYLGSWLLGSRPGRLCPSSRMAREPSPL